MKHALKSVAIGVCLGIALLFVQISLRLDGRQFTRGYWAVALTALLGAVAVNLGYNAYYLHKLRKMAKLWADEEPQRYVDGVQALLKTAKGRRLRDLLTLNLAAGYVGTRAFDRAIAMLEDFDDRDLKGAVEKVVHRINLCMSYFYTAQYEKAMALYEENRQLLGKFRNDKTYGAHIALIDIIAAIIGKQFDQAEAMLAKARKSWPSPPFQKAFSEVERTMEQLRLADGGELR